MSDSSIDESNSFEVPSSLIDKMQKAGTYDELRECWEELAATANLSDTPRYLSHDLSIKDQLLVNLRYMQDLFCNGSFACDSFARNLLDELGLREALISSGIPLEFVLQTVRIGAVKDLLKDTEKSPGHSVQLLSPLSEDLSGGFNWANDHLIELRKQEEEEEKKAKEIEALRIEHSKQAAIVEIGEKMYEPGYEMSPEHKALLKDDVQHKLMIWKAFCDSCLSSPAIRTFYSGEFSDEEITPELFSKFKEACQGDPEVKRFLERGQADFPFEIINPESGWFYALLKTDKTTFRGFLSAAVSNMENWFYRKW